MLSCVGLNPSARKVMRFWKIGSECPLEASHGRQQSFLIPEDPRNIAAENPPAIFRFGTAFSGEGLSYTDAETVPVAWRERAVFLSDNRRFVRQKRSLCEAVRSQVESQIFYRMARQRKHYPLSQTPSYKYSFRLNEEQEIRFRQMLAVVGLEHNRSRFIVKRLFAERFEVIRATLQRWSFWRVSTIFTSSFNASMRYSASMLRDGSPV